MSMGTGIHAYDMLPQAWPYGCMSCMELGSSGVLIHMHGCNRLGQHGSKLVCCRRKFQKLFKNYPKRKVVRDHGRITSIHSKKYTNVFLVFCDGLRS